MLREPRSLKVHAIVEPTGDATRLSGEGKLRICSTVYAREAVCGTPRAIMNAANRQALGNLIWLLRTVGAVYDRPYSNSWFQCDFLHSPVDDFAYIQLVLASAIHFMNGAEFL